MKKHAPSFLLGFFLAAAALLTMAQQDIPLAWRGNNIPGSYMGVSVPNGVAVVNTLTGEVTIHSARPRQ